MRRTFTGESPRIAAAPRHHADAIATFPPQVIGHKVFSMPHFIYTTLHIDYDHYFIVINGSPAAAAFD